MADIKKCDICGRIYQGGEHQFSSGTYSSSVSITDYDDYTSIEKRTYDRFDTCPTCTTRVQKFIASMMIEAEAGLNVMSEQPCKCRRRRKCRKEASR